MFNQKVFKHGKIEFSQVASVLWLERQRIWYLKDYFKSIIWNHFPISFYTSSTPSLTNFLYFRAFPAAPEYLSFPKLSAFSIPYMFAMEICLYLALVIGYLGFLRYCIYFKNIWNEAPKTEMANTRGFFGFRNVKMCSYYSIGSSLTVIARLLFFYRCCIFNSFRGNNKIKRRYVTVGTMTGDYIFFITYLYGTVSVAFQFPLN